MLNGIFSSNPAFNISTCILFLFCFLFKSGIPRNLVASSCFLSDAFPCKFQCFLPSSIVLEVVISKAKRIEWINRWMSGRKLSFWLVSSTELSGKHHQLVSFGNFWVVLRLFFQASSTKIFKTWIDCNIFHWMEKTHHAIATRSRREILHPRSRSFPDAEAEASFEILRDSLGGKLCKIRKAWWFSMLHPPGVLHSRSWSQQELFKILPSWLHDLRGGCFLAFWTNFQSDFNSGSTQILGAVRARLPDADWRGQAT